MKPAKKWFQLLTNKAGLKVRPLTEAELWEHLYQRLNPIQPVLPLKETKL